MNFAHRRYLLGLASSEEASLHGGFRRAKAWGGLQVDVVLTTLTERGYRLVRLIEADRIWLDLKGL